MAEQCQAVSVVCQGTAWPSSASRRPLVPSSHQPIISPPTHTHTRRIFIRHINSLGKLCVRNIEKMCTSGDCVNSRCQPHPQGTFKGQKLHDCVIYEQNHISLKMWNVINYLCVPFLYIKHAKC